MVVGSCFIVVWCHFDMLRCHSIRHQTPKKSTTRLDFLDKFCFSKQSYMMGGMVDHTKNYIKKHFRALFRPPPQNDLQCTTVQCNVLKCKRLNYSLQMGQIRPIMTQDDCVWQGMTYQGSGGFQGVQGGTRGAPGGARGDQATPDAKMSDKTAK